MELIVSLDPGTSLTKIVYQVVAQDVSCEPKIISMEPSVIEVDEELIDIYESRKIYNPSPENDAWIKYEENYYAVGFLAQKYFDARNSLKELKYENSIPKVLAACGAIVTREANATREANTMRETNTKNEANGNKTDLGCNFDLSLALLLPYGEWEDRERLENALANALKEFNFQSQNFCVNLKVFECMPEGGGLMLTQSRKLGDRFNSMAIAILMLGYRDVSTVVFDRGIPSGSSDKFGLVWMLEKIRTLTSGQNLYDLIKPIHQAGSKPNEKNLKSLIKSKNEDFRADEIENLISSVLSSRKEYWKKISDWLFANIPVDIDLVIIGGGTSKYFHKELKKYFSDTKISWASELEEDIILDFDIPKKRNELPLRFTDVYGLFRYVQKMSEIATK